MRKLVMVALVASMLTPGILYVANVSGDTTTKQATTSGTDMTEVSYCIGITFGKSMRGQEIDIDLPAFADGIKAGVEGTESKYTEAEMREVMLKFQTSMMEKQVEAQKEAAKAASEKEKQFFQKNKKKDGVSSTDSGLQYRIIKSGDGPKPTSSDSVTVHYHGTLTDGTVFDSSYERGEPVTFQVDRVIAGWTEALQLMHEGDKWELYIPSNLAYGSHGAGGRIGPNETLVFEVELIKVGSAESASSPKASKDVS